MRYHFVVNGYSIECLKQMQEQKGFVKNSSLEEGEAIIYCRNAKEIETLGQSHSKKAVVITAEDYVPEVVLEKLSVLMKDDELYIFGSDNSGMELAVRAAERRGGSSIVGATAVDISDDLVFVKKMVYSNHMEGTFLMGKGPYAVTIAKGADRKELACKPFEIQEELHCKIQAEHIISSQFYKEEEEKGLEDAKVILAAGRGIGSKDNIRILENAANLLGGEVGVSRPAAMNAWAPMNKLIGVSGTMAGPEICITAGVSGAAAFYAGIEKSKFIAAINKDEKAPIMKMADVAIIDDFAPVLMALAGIIEKDN